MKFFVKRLLSLIVIFSLVGCNASDIKTSEKKDPSSKQTSDDDSKKRNAYPIEITNNNVKTVYEKAPERVIAMDYNAASTLVALGQGDKIIATREAGLPLDNVGENYREEIKNMEIPDGYAKSPLPPLEVTLSLKPDFILMDSYYFNAPDIFGTYKDYQDNGIHILVTEGSLDKKAELKDMYVDINNLGKIFHVEDQSDKLCKQLEKQFSDIKSRVDSSKTYKVMGFDNGDDKPMVAAGNSLENLLISEAGAENIFKDIDKQFATVSWEDVVNRNPDYIILHETPDDKGAQNLIHILKSNKDIADVTAIKEDHFIVVPLRYMFSGIYTVKAFDLIVQGLYG